MRVVLNYKNGWYAKKRILKIYHGEDIYLTEVKRGEKIEVEIPENAEFIYGKIDWGKTKCIKVQELCEGACVVIDSFKTRNPIKNFAMDLGLTTIPIKFTVKGGI